MKVKYLGKFYVEGITTRTNNKIELDETTAQIPQLWQRYVDENIESKTFNKSRNLAMYGVYNKYEKNVNSDYDYTIGVEVTKSKNAITIEKDRYLVFSKKGEFPKYEVLSKIWMKLCIYKYNKKLKSKKEKNNEYFNLIQG